MFDKVTDIELGVGQLPFNFQVGKDRDAIHFRTPKTPAGEFEVRLDDCDGPVIATLPLAPAVRNPGVTRLTAPVAPPTGPYELFLTYIATRPHPLWTITTVNLPPLEPC